MDGLMSYGIGIDSASALCLGPIPLSGVALMTGRAWRVLICLTLEASLNYQPVLLASVPELLIIQGRDGDGKWEVQ